MRKSLLLFLLFLLCLNRVSYGQEQRDYAQELYYLLAAGRYFEAQELKLKHKDQFKRFDEDVDLVYNMQMSLAFNKPDSAIVYFEEFLANPYYVHNIGPAVGQFYVSLCETYEEKQQFEMAVSTIERYINYLKENPYSLDTEHIQKEIGDAQNKINLLKEKIRNEPIRKVVRDGESARITLKDNSHIRFDAQYNGHVLETFFDTGVSEFCAMEKDLADKIGVKYNPYQAENKIVNGKSIRVIEGYLDSIKLKGITLYNIPVTIVIGKFNANLPSNLNSDFRQALENDLLKSEQVFFGLPAIKMLGRFEFDWKSNILVIPPVQQSAQSSPNPNMMLYKKGVFVDMNINDTAFVGHLDLGSDQYIGLTYPYFFKSNSIYVQNDPQQRPFIGVGFMGVQENVEQYRVHNPKIDFDGRRIDTTKSQRAVNPMRAVYAIAGLNDFDGIVGLGFFKNTFSKTVIDFNTMTVTCED